MSNDGNVEIPIRENTNQKKSLEDSKQASEPRYISSLEISIDKAEKHPKKPQIKSNLKMPV